MAKEIKFEVQLSIGFPSAIKIDTLSIWVEGDETEEQIEELKREVAIEWMYDNTDLNWT